MWFCPLIKVLFKLPLRQSVGMIASLPRLTGRTGRFRTTRP